MRAGSGNSEPRTLVVEDKPHQSGSGPQVGEHAALDRLRATTSLQGSGEVVRSRGGAWLVNEHESGDAVYSPAR